MDKKLELHKLTSSAKLSAQSQSQSHLSKSSIGLCKSVNQSCQLNDFTHDDIYFHPGMRRHSEGCWEAVFFIFHLYITELCNIVYYMFLRKINNQICLSIKRPEQTKICTYTQEEKNPTRRGLYFQYC